MFIASIAKYGLWSPYTCFTIFQVITRETLNRKYILITNLNSNHQILKGKQGLIKIMNIEIRSIIQYYEIALINHSEV